MHVAFVDHNYLTHESPEELLDRLFTVTDWAKALCGAGLKVTVFTRFHSDYELQIDEVNYVFVEDPLRPALRSWQLASRFHKKVIRMIDELEVDVVHTHNTLAFGTNWSLGRLLKDKPLVVQDHVGLEKLPRPALLKMGLKRADAVLFSAHGQEEPWVKHGVLDRDKVHFVMENSSKFQMMDRAASRKHTGLTGAPIVLWVGNLNANKDPLTALQSFERILEVHPESRLYMIYKESTLEAEVRTFLEHSDLIEDQVTLLGLKMREEMEHYYNSSDYIISASYKEGSGYAVIEAMSCGVIPILTDIPSFASLTHQGQVGALFERGNASAMTEAMLKQFAKPLAEERERVHEHFQQQFSFEALGVRMSKLYERLI